MCVDIKCLGVIIAMLASVTQINLRGPLKVIRGEINIYRTTYGMV